MLLGATARAAAGAGGAVAQRTGGPKAEAWAQHPDGPIAQFRVVRVF